MAYVYLIEFPQHPNVYYVGKTKRNVEKRFREHFIGSMKKNKTSKLCHWYKNNDFELKYTILEDTTVEEVDFLEVFWIRYLRYLGIVLTNHHDDETISIDWTNERKNQMSEFRKQHKFSDETKLKMSLSKMMMKVTWGDKISKGKKGKPNPFTLLHKQNLTESRRLNQGRRVTLVDGDGNEISNFITIGDAAQHVINLKPHLERKRDNIRNGIKDCCTGKQKTAYGFIWVYSENLKGQK